ADRHRERFGLEALALADRAGDFAHVLLDVRANELRGRLAMLAGQPRQQALPFVLVGAFLSALVLVAELQRILSALEERVDRLLRKLPHRIGERELVLLRE